jgi:hypothetical protein
MYAHARKEINPGQINRIYIFLSMHHGVVLVKMYCPALSPDCPDLIS